LSKEQEQHLFRQMNYLKFKAIKLILALHRNDSDFGGIDSILARIQKLAEIEHLLGQANQVKELLISANLRLVVSVGQRYANPTQSFFELLSDGNLSMIRAVEKFDYSRNFKFCTYATRAIMMRFARTIPGEKHHGERFMTSKEEILTVASDNRTVEQDVL